MKSSGFSTTVGRPGGFDGFVFGFPGCEFQVQFQPEGQDVLVRVSSRRHGVGVSHDGFSPGGLNDVESSHSDQPLADMIPWCNCQYARTASPTVRILSKSSEGRVTRVPNSKQSGPRNNGIRVTHSSDISNCGSGNAPNSVSDV